MEQENNPAVIMIEMTMDNGTSPQNVHSDIAKAYNVPVISYHDAIMPEIEAGTIKWSDISPIIFIRMIRAWNSCTASYKLCREN